MLGVFRRLSFALMLDLQNGNRGKKLLSLLQLLVPCSYLPETMKKKKSKPFLGLGPGRTQNQTDGSVQGSTCLDPYHCSQTLVYPYSYNNN